MHILVGLGVGAYLYYQYGIAPAMLWYLVGVAGNTLLCRRWGTAALLGRGYPTPPRRDAFVLGASFAVGGPLHFAAMWGGEGIDAFLHRRNIKDNSIIAFCALSAWVLAINFIPVVLVVLSFQRSAAA